MGNKTSKYSVETLKELPYKYAKAIVINGEIIIIPLIQNQCRIYCYDYKQNEWMEMIEYENGLDISYTAYEFDKASNILQIYSDEKKDKSIKIFNINLATKTWDIIHIKNVKDDGISSFVAIDGNLHIIGDNKHRIWSKQSQTIREIDPFDMNISSYHSMIHLKTKRKLMVFGGFTKDANECSDAIHSYSLKTEQWIKLNVRLPKKLHLMATTVTKNEEYVILIGGYGADRSIESNSTDIYIYNVDKESIVKSKISCPSKGLYRAVIVDNYMQSELLTHGYIRKMKMAFPPQEIVSLIHCMSIVEYLHFMKHTMDRSHWRIKLDALFS